MNWKLLTLSAFTLFATLQAQAQIELNIEWIEQVQLVNEEKINSEHLEFSPFFYHDYLGFVYSNPKARIDPAINEHFFDLGFSARGIDGSLIKRAAFNANINGLYHEGPSSFDRTKNLLYFSRTAGDAGTGPTRDTIHRSIYFSEERNDFAEVLPIDLNHANYSVCHPSLFVSGKKMVYASGDRMMGDMDLRMAEGQKSAWKKTNDLSRLNTEANEVFPFVFIDSILFFASDRPGGIGGLDIYYAYIRNGDWSHPELLPFPFNTTFDDFGFILSDDGKMGYLTSNRPGGLGKDDIYSFTSKQALFTIKKPKAFLDLQVTIVDKLTLLPVAASVVVSDISLKNDRYNLDDFDVNILSGEKSGELLMKLSPKANRKLDSIAANKLGQVALKLQTPGKYIIKTTAAEYETNTLLYNAGADPKQINIVLSPIPKEAPPVVEEIFIPVNVGEKVVFENIYYERNSAVIQEGAARELDALAKVMLELPTMEVQLSAHTDARGTEAYNQDLSMRRALSARDYLVAKGVEARRIKALGYGESRIRNHCFEGVRCSEEDHLYNRRTEVVVVKN